MTKVTFEAYEHGNYRSPVNSFLIADSQRASAIPIAAKKQGKRFIEPDDVTTLISLGEWENARRFITDITPCLDSEEVMEKAWMLIHENKYNMTYFLRVE